MVRGLVRSCVVYGHSKDKSVAQWQKSRELPHSGAQQAGQAARIVEAPQRRGELLFQPLAKASLASPSLRAQALPCTAGGAITSAPAMISAPLRIAETAGRVPV